MVAGTHGSLNKAGSTKMTQISTTAGIDTSRAKLDIAVHGGVEHWQVENTSVGWRRLAVGLSQAGVTRVGIEASGGYERGVVGYLRDKGLTVLVLQPIQVKAYARVHLRRAKNDKLDAVLIAACAATIDQPRIEPDERLAKLARHLTFVEQIEEDIARFKVRLEHIDNPRLRRMVLADIARLKLDAPPSCRASSWHCAPMRILAAVSISCSAFPVWASAPPSPSSSACRSSAASVAKKPQRSPVSHLTMMTAESIKGSDTSPAAEDGYAVRCSPLRYPPHSAGTKP